MDLLSCSSLLFLCDSARRWVVRISLSGRGQTECFMANPWDVSLTVLDSLSLLRCPELNDPGRLDREDNLVDRIGDVAAVTAEELGTFLPTPFSFSPLISEDSDATTCLPEPDAHTR